MSLGMRDAWPWVCSSSPCHPDRPAGLPAGRGGRTLRSLHGHDAARLRSSGATAGAGGPQPVETMSASAAAPPRLGGGCSGGGGAGGARVRHGRLAAHSRPLLRCLLLEGEPWSLSHRGHVCSGAQPRHARLSRCGRGMAGAHRPHFCTGAAAAGMRIGIASDLLPTCDPDIAQVTRAAVATLAGAALRWPTPCSPDCLPAWMEQSLGFCPARARGNWRAFPLRPRTRCLRRALPRVPAMADSELAAFRATCAAARADVDDLFAAHDALLLPVMPCVTPPSPPAIRTFRGFRGARSTACPPSTALQRAGPACGRHSRRSGWQRHAGRPPACRCARTGPGLARTGAPDPVRHRLETAPPPLSWRVSRDHDRPGARQSAHP